MTGHDTFEQIVAFAALEEQTRPPIPYENFELWQKDYTWDGLHGIRYGQSFCNRFGITDNLLYYTTWPCEQIDEYIKKIYVERS